MRRLLDGQVGVPMTRTDEVKLIRDHIETALWLADGLPTNPGQMLLRDTLVGALQEVECLYPAAERRAESTR